MRVDKLTLSEKLGFNQKIQGCLQLFLVTYSEPAPLVHSGLHTLKAPLELSPNERSHYSNSHYEKKLFKLPNELYCKDI